MTKNKPNPYIMKKSVKLVLILLLFAGCSARGEVDIPGHIKELENLTAYSADTEPAAEISFEPEALFGDNEEVIIGQITNATVDTEGRVFIADFRQSTIYVYESDGTYLRQLGGEGEGPGEFGNLGAVHADTDYLYAMDWNRRRLNVFSLTDLQFEFTINLMDDNPEIEELQNRYPGNYFVKNDGTILVAYGLPYRPDTDPEEERHTIFYEVDRNGDIKSDELFSQRAPDILSHQTGDGARIVGMSPFGGRPLFALTGDGRPISAWSEDFLIKFHTTDGEYERAFYYPYEKSEVDRQEVIDSYENDQMKQMVRNAEAPDTWPALNSLEVDDQNRLWVSTIVGDDEVYEWWILEEDGELLAKFTWPRSRNLQQIKNGFVYAIESEEESGLQRVVQYRVALDES